MSIQENNHRVINQLNYAFKNVRIHQKELFGAPDEEYILGSMKELGGFDNIVRTTQNGNALKYGFRGIFNGFYGDDWADFHYYQFMYDSDLGY